MKIAIAQFNAVLGDIAGNAHQISCLAALAREQGADVLLTPELALCGCPPEDLLLRPDFYVACEQAVSRLVAEIEGIDVILGHPLAENGRYYNAATLFGYGQRKATYRKQSLPTYQTFDEVRYFAPGNAPCVVEIAGIRCGLAIGADVWEAGAAESAQAAGAEILLILNASPFYLQKQSQRLEVLRQRISATGLPMVSANLVGGQDELVFDGASLALDSTGELCMRLPFFEETLAVLEFERGALHGQHVAPLLQEEEEAYRGLVLGVRDYIGKNGFPGVIVGLSGGIDSALTLCIAVDALGPDKVRAVMMASPYTAQMSLDDSRALVEALGIQYDEIPITSAMQVFETMLSSEFAGLPADTTEENLQARIRGMILMALSNKKGALVLTTGNKSEMAVGYATLYGDMAGGLAVLKDVYKTLVYRLSRYRNTLSPVIPENIITRPPTAELKPGQTDQDSLPPYEILDAIVKAYMEENRSVREIIADGLPEEAVRKVVRLMRITEYKRRQAPVGIRITPRSFGKDWRYPMTNHYRDAF